MLISSGVVMLSSLVPRGVIAPVKSCGGCAHAMHCAPGLHHDVRDQFKRRTIGSAELQSHFWKNRTQSIIRYARNTETLQMKVC
jgi:hypothetical protein